MAQVIVAVKTSAWDRHGPWYEEQHRHGSLSDAEHQRIKQAHTDHCEAVALVKDRFDQDDIDYRLVNIDDDSWNVDQDTKVVVTLGGDGTLLSASHRIGSQSITMFGVRSSGTSVGYLCAGGTERLKDLISSIKTGQFKVLHAARFHAEVHSTKSSSPCITPPALNDFLYSATNPAAMTRYRISLGERQEDHKSSGMWLSTALGSTAGILAAGGVMQPRPDRNFQFVVRELYRQPGRNFYLVNGFFDPDKKTFVIENRCESAILAADGNHSVTNISWGDRIIFKRSVPLKIAE